MCCCVFDDMTIFESYTILTACLPFLQVDRITPGTTDEDVTYLEDTFGYDDQGAVFCEPWRQWVLEDKFCAGRPPLEKLDGVIMCNNVEDYEVRIVCPSEEVFCSTFFLTLLSH